MSELSNSESLPMPNFLTSQTQSSQSHAAMPVSMQTLQQFRVLYRPDASGRTVASCRQIAAILLAALKRELSKVPKMQNVEFVLELLKDLTRYRHSETYPVVAKVAAEHSVLAIRERAAEITLEMSNSLKTLWDETMLDPNADLGTRLQNLKRARVMPYSPSEIAAVIFSECKALTFRSGAEQVTEELRDFFKHSDEQVRLAAAWVIVNDWATREQHILRETVFVLADLATNARNLGCSNDAFQLLKQIRNLSPFVDSMVGHGESRANARFAELNLVESISVPKSKISPIAMNDDSVTSYAAPAPVAAIGQVTQVSALAPSNVELLSLSRTAFFQRYSA